MSTRKKPLSQVLGPLEAEVMQVVWDRGEVTVRDVLKHLSRQRRIAYTTVMTTMSRLADKGLLNRIESSPAHRYSPALTKEQYARSTVKTVVGWLMSHFPDPAVSYLLDRIEDEDEEILELLKEAIERRSRTQR